VTSAGSAAAGCASRDVVVDVVVAAVDVEDSPLIAADGCDCAADEGVVGSVPALEIDSVALPYAAPPLSSCVVPP